MGLNAKFGLNDGSFAVRYLLNFARDAYIIMLLRTCGGGKERGDGEMAGSETLSITMHYKRVELQIREILYVSILNNTAEFHMADGTLYKMRFPFSRLEPLLGDGFIKTHRNCLVAVRAIHDLSDKVYLCDGSELLYASRRRKELSAELRVKRQRLFDRFADEHPARSGEQCRERYRVFDELPIAFMDIEAAVEPKENTVDWIVRYGNEALARLGEEPPGELIGKRLSDVYPGIKEKWLRTRRVLRPDARALRLLARGRCLSQHHRLSDHGGALRLHPAGLRTDAVRPKRRRRGKCPAAIHRKVPRARQMTPTP